MLHADGISPEIASTESPVRHREIAASEIASTAKADDEYPAAPARHNAEQSPRQPDERKFIAEAQDMQEKIAETQINQTKQDNVTQNRDDSKIDLEADRVYDQTRRDREESLFDAEPASLGDETTELEGAAPQRVVELGSQEEEEEPAWGPQETQPPSTTDQRHELSPTRQASTAAEDTERSPGARMGDLSERETIPIPQQAEMLGKENERSKDLLLAWGRAMLNSTSALVNAVGDRL